ncbi:MAG: HD domain-containing protein [Rhizomicrobium sp.]
MESEEHYDWLRPPPRNLWTLPRSIVNSLRSVRDRVLALVGVKSSRQTVTIEHALRTDGVRGYSYLQPLNFVTSINASTFLTDIIKTHAFQRLASVRFLGGIDYVLVRSPNGNTKNVRYTRSQHSLGVARLALHYATTTSMQEEEARTIFVAALLHDVGHAPFSHSLEPVFECEFGINHHKATEDVICGRTQIGRDLSHILMQNHVDIDRVIALLNGSDTGFNGFFSGPINFDTIEGISRCRMYGRNDGSTSNPSIIVDAATKRVGGVDCDIVDGFWNQKNEVYKYIIGSRTNVLADCACQQYMRNNLTKFSKEDYYSTEEAAFRKLPGLYQLLTSRSFELDVWHLVKNAIEYSARTFYVDAGYDFFARDDLRRYKQFRESHVLEARAIDIDAAKSMKDLFDDHAVSEGQTVF